MPSSLIYQNVEQGLVDIGIGYLIENNPHVLSSVLYYDTFELAVSPLHPLASMPAPTLGTLKDVPLIMLSPDTVGRVITSYSIHYTKLYENVFQARLIYGNESVIQFLNFLLVNVNT